MDGLLTIEHPILINGWFGGKTHYFQKHPYESVAHESSRPDVGPDGIDDHRLRPQPFPGVQLET